MGTRFLSKESSRGCLVHSPTSPSAEQSRCCKVRVPYAGEYCVELSKEFRANAAQCLKLSHEANSTGSQAYWVAMAQFWFQLAQHAEDREAVESVDPAAVKGPNDGSRRARRSPHSP